MKFAPRHYPTDLADRGAIAGNGFFDRSRAATRAARSLAGGFTLIEVLAALLLMAIIVPVAMQGMNIATRAGVLGQRKAAAMRVADNVLNELIVTGQATQGTTSGSVAEGDLTYSWTMESVTWPEDAMSQVTVRVTFSVQGNEYDVSATTLIDPNAGSATPDPTAAL